MLNISYKGVQLIETQFLLTNELMKNLINEFQLELYGTHGILHWNNVLRNGLQLCSKTNANQKVVTLFSVIHDIKRIHDFNDFGHGARASNYAESIRELIPLNDDEFNLLHFACYGHTDGLTEADETVQVCWDSDRLDLVRCGWKVDPDLLCTDAARQILKTTNFN